MLACRADEQTIEKTTLQLCSMYFLSFPLMHTKYSLTTALVEQNEETNASIRLAFPSTHMNRNTEIDWNFFN